MNRQIPFTNWLRLVLAAALALALGVVMTLAPSSPVAQAADVAPDTDFEIDGNPEGPNDFLDEYGPGTTPEGYSTTGLYYNERSVDQGGSSGCDLVNDPSTGKGGTKLGDGPAWPAPGTDPNGKTDLDYIDLAAEKVDKVGEIFDIIYVGYRKCGGTGTWQTSLYLDDGDGVLPSEGDTDGDYLFIFDFNPSTGGVTFLQYKRVANVWTQQPGTSTFIDGRADGDYGEVALNLTELVFTDANGVVSCNSIVVSGPAASITGGSLSSQVKDLVAFPSLAIDNCGDVSIEKETNGAGTSDLFDYDLFRNPSGTVHDGSLQVSGLGAPEVTDEPADGDTTEIDASILGGNTHVWSNVVASSVYDLTEDLASLPSGWELDTIVCQSVDLFGPNPSALDEPVIVYQDGAPTGNKFSIAPAQLAGVPLAATSCVITNDVLGITIAKVGTGTADTPFTFDVEPAVASDVVAVINGASVFQTVPTTGTYTITEDDINALDIGDLEPDWTLTDISCTDGAGAVAPVYDLVAGTATVVVDGSDDDIVCTFTNSQAARIIVEKDADPDDTGAEFDYTFTGGVGPINDIAHGESDSTGDISPGSYTITEVMPGSDPAWVLTGVSCGDIEADGVSVVVNPGAGETVTCVFSNQQQGSITIEKYTVEPGTNTPVSNVDSTFEFTSDAPLSGSSITTVAGVTPGGSELTANNIMPGAYTVTEDTAATPGYTLESVSCDDGDSVRNGDAADIALGSGESVTCLFANSRNQATLTLAKDWGAATLDGETVVLGAIVSSGDGPADAPIAVNATSTGAPTPVSTYLPTDRTMTVYSGQTIAISEAFVSPTDPDAFATTLLCGPTGGNGVINIEPDVDGNQRAAVYEVGDDPVDVTCTFTNVPKQAGVSLVKSWVDAETSPAESTDIGLSTSPSGNSAGATSTAIAPTFIDPDNTAFVPVVAGDTVTFTESNLTNAANYTTTFACTGSDQDPVEVDTYTYTLEITTTDVDNDAAIICEFVNTRNRVDLVLEKVWIDAKVGDEVLVEATGSDAGDASYASTADTPSDTDTDDAVEVFAGEDLTLSESFTTGDPLAYDSSLSCTGPDAATDGQLTVDAAADSITCTWTNTRRSVEVVVEKDLLPAGDDGTFDLSINGQVVASGGDGTSNAGSPVTVLVGDPVDLAEAATGPALENYTSSLVCDNGIAPSNNDGISGDFVVPSSLASDTTITCTFTNVRNEAPLIVTKSWGPSPVDPDPDMVDLLISGGLATPDQGMNSNDGVANDDDADTTVYAGESINVGEDFTGSRDAEHYDTTLVCTDASGELLSSSGSLSGTVDVPADPTAITCTFTNQRKSATITVDKRWINPQTGDVASITAAGVDPSSPAEGDSTVAGPFNQTNLAVVTLTVWSGETVDLDEVITLTPPNDAPRYDSELVCNDQTIGERSGSVDIGPADQSMTITCVFRNDRRGVNLVLTKDWDDSPANGDAVTLDIAGGQIPPTVTAPEATSSNDGDAGNDADAVGRGLVGETITLSEVFVAGAAENYATSFECIDGNQATIVGQVTYTDGALVGTLDITADMVGPVTCEFTNDRLRTPLTLEKAWVAPVDDDEADISIDATNDGSTTATAPAADGTSTETVTVDVYAGEQVVLSETIDPNGTNAALYDATAFSCTAGTPNPAWADGETSLTIDVSAADTASPITCTVTNTAQRGTITIVKNIDGVNNGVFDFTGDWTDGVTPAGAFQIDTGAEAPDLTGMITYSGVLVPKDGSPYSVVETDAGANFDGTSVTCVDVDGGSGPAASSDLPLTGSIDLDPGEAVLCTFTNTEKASIIVIKDAQPDSAAEFDFTGDIGDFTLVDDGVDDITDRYPSSLLKAEDGDVYTITELETPGWALTSATCIGADDFGLTGESLDVDVAPGVTAQCTFVNEALPAGLTATKTVEGVVGPWGPFTFTLTGQAPAATFTGDAAQDVDNSDVPGSDTATWENLVEGEQYLLTESAVAGYQAGATFTCEVLLPGAQDVVGVTDENGDAAGFLFTAVAGAIYTCDITNVAIDPTLVVEKTTVGGTGEFTFDVTPTDGAYPVGPLTADTGIVNPASSATVDLQAGIGYTVAEQLSDEWVEGSLTCTVTDANGASGPYALDTPTQPGDEISCEITNTRRAQIVIEKTTVPAGGTGFGFTGDVGDFVLDDGDSFTSAFVDPDATYVVTESAAPGTALTAVECDSDNGVGDIDARTATVTPAPGEIVTCEFTNTQRGPVDVDKTATTGVVRNGATYSVTYELTVTNESYIDEPYSLSDTPDMADNVTITSMIVNGPGVSDLELGPDGGAIVTDGVIAARAGQLDGPDALVFTVVVEFTMTPSNTSQDCVDGEGGNGAFNGATVTFEEPPTTNSDDDCVDLPEPLIDVEKTADSAVATQVAGFQYEAVFTVTVTNTGEGPGSYTLADLPDFASGAVDSVTFSPLPDAVSNVIEPEGVDVYTVTVLFTVAGDLPLIERPCGDTPTPGQGGYNNATVTYGPTPDPTDDACIDIPDPEITVSKVRTSDVATLVDGTVYSASYTVTVSNIGDGPGVYGIADVPVVAGDSVISTTINPVPVDGTPLAAGASDVYTVTVLFDVPGDLSVDERTCVETRDEPGSGAYNGVTVTYNDGQTGFDDDCVDIPNPNVDHSKVVVGEGAVYNGDNEWTVTYDVVVTNLDPDEADGIPVGPSQYDLSDTFDFGPGVTVDGVAVSVDPSGDITLNASFDGETDTTVTTGVLIAAGATHTYTIVVDVTIVPTPDTNGDCSAEGGLRNAAGLSVATDVGVERPDAEACADYQTLTLIKLLSDEDDGGNASIDDFTLTATLGQTVILSGTSPVSESVPTGEYALAETQLPGYVSEGYTCPGYEMEGQSVSVPTGANVTCWIINDDLPVDLELTKDDGGFQAVAGGDPIPYTITVQNIGPRDVDAGEPATMTDTLPSYLSWVTPVPAGCSVSGKTLTCVISPSLLEAGDPPVVFNLLVDVAPTAPSGVFVNRAQVDVLDDPVCEPVGECTPPPCPAANNNNVDCEETPIDREATITITKVDNVAAGDTVLVGDTFTYTLTVDNNGPSTIQPGLKVTDDLPAQLEFVSATGNNWTCNAADPVVCTYGPSLAPGATAPAITVTVQVAESATGDTIENTAVATGFVEPGCPAAQGCEPVTDDDDETTPLLANADLAIVKTASVLQVQAPGAFSFTLDVTNNGPAPAVNVVVGDLVPSGVTVTGVASDFFDCDNTGNDVECTVASMAVGASGSVTITVAVPGDTTAGSIDNVGTVESDTPDPDLSNNSDDATVILVAQAPPVTVAPTIPPTGSNSTTPMVRAALLFLLLGAIGVAATRRRRDDATGTTV